MLSGFLSFIEDFCIEGLGFRLGLFDLFAEPFDTSADVEHRTKVGKAVDHQRNADEIHQCSYSGKGIKQDQNTKYYGG